MSQLAHFHKPRNHKFQTVLRNTVIADDENQNILLQNKFMTYYTGSRVENKPLIKKQLLQKQKQYIHQKESQHSIDEIASFEAKLDMKPQQIKPVIIQPLTNDEKDKLEMLLPPRYLQYYDVYTPNQLDLDQNSKLETASLSSKSSFKSTASRISNDTIKTRNADLCEQESLSSSRSQPPLRAIPGNWCLLDDPLIPSKPFGVITKPTVHDHPFIQTSCCSRSTIPLYHQN